MSDKLQPVFIIAQASLHKTYYSKLKLCEACERCYINDIRLCIYKYHVITRLCDNDVRQSHAYKRY